MTHDFERQTLWKSSLAKRTKADENEVVRDRLRGAYLKCRDRVSHLVSTIKSELPGLTVHDITHLDALWRVASEIAGPKYELTPAEAFVLGGAILLHDSAHAIAAFPGGKAEIKQTQHWRDLIAQRYNRQEPAVGSDDERAALFQVLRHLHATQASKLPFVKWSVPGDNTPNFLIEDAELRNYYGELIGRIAESHHWPAHRVAAEFSHQNHTPPSYLPTDWTVDAMKVAFVLRTADAAHIDDGRAPWFLFALQNPLGISEQHWRFQSKLGQVKCNKHGELQISSGPSFSIDEREAWWLAYDTVQMVDRELRDAHGLMRDHVREVFCAISVLGAGSPESFARYVKPIGWEPVDVAPKIGNVNKIIETLGGTKLYGDHPDLALRELIQNAIDAIQARRALGGLGQDEGCVVVSLSPIDENTFRLCVADNGVGMSKSVLTNVLLDFGNSLWKSDGVRQHLPGLADTDFESAGQFGIGFFAVFMLGNEVTVGTRAWRNAKTSATAGSQYRLTFTSGLASRPSLQVGLPIDGLADAGTVVSVNLTAERLESMLEIDVKTNRSHERLALDAKSIESFSRRVKSLVPMSGVNVFIESNGNRNIAISANDWQTVSNKEIAERTLSRTVSTEEVDDLHPVYGDDGSMLGRVSLRGRSGSLVLAHKGIRCGAEYDLSGLLSCAGPAKAERNLAKPLHIPFGSWRAWAQLAVAAGQLITSQNHNAVLTLLLPEQDLPVYGISGKGALAIRDVTPWLKRIKRFYLIDDSVELKTERSAKFRGGDYFQVAANCICMPQIEYDVPDVWQSLELPKIDFMQRLLLEVSKLWGSYSRIEIMRHIIGHAPLERRGYALKKTAPGGPIYGRVTMIERSKK